MSIQLPVYYLYDRGLLPDLRYAALRGNLCWTETKLKGNFRVALNKRRAYQSIWINVQSINRYLNEENLEWVLVKLSSGLGAYEFKLS